MATVLRRKNEGILLWLRATVVTVAVLGALVSLKFNPGWGAALLALIAGGLTLATADLGVLAAIISIGLPLTAANPVVGITFVVLGVVGIRYLGADGGQVFLVVAAGVAGAILGPAWAAVVIAGIAMTAGDAAIAAAVACITVEIVGLVMGKPAIGLITTGGTEAIISLAKVPESFFAPTWVAEAFSGVGAKTVNNVVDTVSAMQQPVALVVQPVLWAGAAAIASVLARAARERGAALLVTVVGALAAVVPALGYALLAPVTGTSAQWGPLGVAVMSTAVVGAGFGFVWEKAFPIERIEQAKSKAHRGPMAAEDADVDELLSLIATAEEKLTSQHTTTKVVMITDMKSFSKMTEEDGSILTAKAIQKHRDLLLPVIERHGGHGKSTGGDGLVAAFDDPLQALIAAAEMQNSLDKNNRDHPDDREMTVRIGVARGEVVLDKSGRPFIGAALNLAARVMNLADGGQAFVTADVASAGGGELRVQSLGEFELKNIAKPVEVVEVLWSEGQQARSPLNRQGA